MRILTVLNWLVRAGIEITLYRCLSLLQKKGIFVDVCCFGPPAPLDDAFRAAGCRIIRIGKYANPYATATKLSKLLREGSWQVVHSRFGYTSGGIALAASRSRLPVAVSFHNSVATSLYDWDRRPILRLVKRAWLHWHRRLMQRHVDVFVGHSEVNIAAYEPRWRARPGRYRVVVNGVSFPQENVEREKARRQLGIPGDSLVLLHVGSFKTEKNHPGLLHIARGVMHERPDSVLVLVGDGRLRRPTEQLAAEMGVGGNVRFDGAQKDVWPYYFAADVLVFPSEEEGFANVLTEAQGVGLPVVASDIPAHRESVAPSQHRFLFPLPEYDRAVELVLEQADHAGSGENDWVAASREHARRKCGMERMADDLAQLYADLVERRR